MLEVDVAAVGPPPAHDDRCRGVEVLAGLVPVVGVDQLVPDLRIVEDLLDGHAEDRDDAVADVLEALIGQEPEPIADEVARPFHQQAEALV